MKKFSAAQKMILCASAIAYTTAYFNRLNLSAALSALMGVYGISQAQGGLLQSAFAITYACGQLINGSITGRVDPRKHLGLGLLGTAVCNVLMSVCRSYGLFLMLCVCNGIFQSMLWTPIVNMIAMFFTDKRQQNRANFVMSFTLIAGHLGAWAISGVMVSTVGWRMSFAVPACIAFPVLACTLWLLRPVKGAKRAVKAEHAEQKVFPLKLFLSTGFFWVLLSCVLYGFVRDGIITWAPDILRGIGGGNTLSATGFTLIIPAINTFGLLLSYMLIRRGNRNVRMVIAGMLLLSGVFCLVLRLSGGMLVTALMMGLACACLYGMNTLLTSIVPLEYDIFGHAAQAAGMVDCLIYVGSALAGVTSGKVLGTGGTATLYVVWTVGAVLGAAAMAIAGSAKCVSGLRRD